MNEAAAYIPRAEEEGIGRLLEAVQADHKSRAILLYGEGGVGKTSLVRHMVGEHQDDDTVWLEPVDVDYPEIWLLSNLESMVVDQLDPGGAYFAEYRERLSRLPSPTRSHISHETIMSHLGRLRDVFARCYGNFTATERKTVVIVFDTVETIRGTNLERTLTQWMKALPADTLFILSGRPLIGDPGGQRDQLKTELDSRYRGMPVKTIMVGEFTRPRAREYIRNSGISGRLVGDEEEALVLLTQGHPLWLAFLIDYLKTEGVPPEATREPLADMERHLSFGEMTEQGRRLREEFLRRLVTPYQEADFWHEAVKRLAVVRQPVTKTVWQHLMSDRTPPDRLSMDDAWKEILRWAWIRPRANDRYLTLHDAIAEELARRLIPLHDQDQRWRQGIWRKALGIYSDLAAEARVGVDQMRADLDEELDRANPVHPAEDAEAARREADLMSRSIEFDKRQRRLDQLRAASLYYLSLTDFEAGCERLLEYFVEAGDRDDSFFQDLLVLYLDRFLPGRANSKAFNDVIGLKLEEFRDWLNGTGRGFYVALGIKVGGYLVDSAQPEEALKFLALLPEGAADVRQRHDLYILRGNACLRTGGMVREAIGHFARAIEHAEAIRTPDRHKLIAQAYKELGYYYRNTGKWAEANASYRHAWATIVNALSADSPDEDRKELASIQTNWAYIMGLDGSYRDGIELAESAIAIRRKLKKTPAADEGMSWSVCGEVYRYARRFEQAWRAYQEAERLILKERPYWDRLGFVYQEQAICLYQADQEGISIPMVQDLMAEADRRIRRALDLCLTYAVRGYPSALNRAGRIVGATDPEAGLKYLEEGIHEAQRLSDGWFWFANLVEYAELSYKRLLETRDPRYRANIEERAGEIDRVAEDYEFPDLVGRWSVLQGHLAVRDYFGSGDVGQLDKALAHYEKGFVDIAQRNVGSSGKASLRTQFVAFRANYSDLPSEVKTAWQARLRSTWAAAGEVSMLLLARLEELV